MNARTTLFIFLIAVILLSLFCCNLIGCSDSNNNTPVDFNTTKEKTTALIQQGLEKNETVGLSLALVSDDEIVWKQGFGYADKENQVPATAETVYMLGSISKTLTAVGVLQLVDKGVINLSDPIADYLPGFEMNPRYVDQRSEMTIERILNHHSGIPGDLLNAAFVTKNWNDWEIGLYKEWLLDYLQGDYPSHRPGEVASYSNTGYILAGDMVTYLSNAQTFNEHMQKALFESLNMSNSSFNKDHEHLAKGYDVKGTVFPEFEANMVSSGGVFTTAEDMGRFIRMILREGQGPKGRILNPDTVDLMGRTERSPLDLETYFQPGLGLDSADDPVMRYAGRAWTKSGSTNRFHTFMEVLPDKNLGVIVLANSASAYNLTHEVARKCLRNAVKEKCGLEPSMPAMPEYDSTRDNIAGIYVRPKGYDRIQQATGSGLKWQRYDAQTNSSESLNLDYNSTSHRYEVEGKVYDLVFLQREWKNKQYTLMLKYSSPDHGKNGVTNGYTVRCRGKKLATENSIPQAWQDRLSKKYIVENIGWNDVFMWRYTYFDLYTKDGVLMITGKTDRALFPKNGTVAFIRGLTNQRKDSSVRVIEEDGMEKLVSGGFKAYPIEEVPLVQVGETVRGTGQELSTKWYKLVLDSQKSLDLSMDSDQYTLRVMDSNLQTSVAQGVGDLTWQAPSGTWYLALSAHPDARLDYELSITETTSSL